jgi:uncharacterized protein YbbC (DUF1343 family)
MAFLVAFLAFAFVIPAAPVHATLAREGEAGRAPVVLGVDVLLSKRIDLIQGKRVGLITNPSGVDGRLVTTLERFLKDGRFRLTQIYAPEHGLAGVMPNGRSNRNKVDPETGIAIEGLFGKRSAPSQESLARVDVLVFDIQDIGSRTYTYVSTMGKAMQAAKKAGVRFVVLDRPNPLGGVEFEGAIRLPKYQSLIGWGPIPVTHGMTAGELARFYNTEMHIGCDLVVVEMENWRRDMVWEDTGLTWVPTSPGIPHTLNAHLYVATGMVGGSGPNVNEGAGNSMPFELIAAPYIESRELADAMNASGLSGVRFRPIAFRPNRGQFARKMLGGAQILLDDPRSFRPLRTALSFLVNLQRLYPDQLKVKDWRRFGRVWGNDEILRMIRQGLTVDQIEASWAAELDEFGKKRAKYLIYE